MWKLVRDKIQGFSQEKRDGRKFKLTENVSEALRDKVLEESKELYEAKTREEKIEEMADCLEVFESICICEAIRWSEIQCQ